MIIMDKAFAAGAVLAASITGAAALACGYGIAQEINGNWYCQPVNAITYSNIDSHGTYNKVTNMENGVCGSTSHSYNGAMAPLDEEVRFRMPILLAEFTDIVCRYPGISVVRCSSSSSLSIFRIQKLENSMSDKPLCSVVMATSTSVRETRSSRRSRKITLSRRSVQSATR